MRTTFRLFACVCLLAVAGPVVAQQSVTTYEETGADGVTYRVTRNVTQQLAPTTEMQTREEKVFRPRVTTQYQNIQQQVLTPVTEYRWVSRMKGRWNPFIQPYWAQELEPVTRWESRQSTVQVPTTKTDWVEERRVVQTPVTTYRTVQNETISRVAVSGRPIAAPNTFQPTPTAVVSTSAAPAAAAPVGGHRLSGDPPRVATGWQSSDGVTRR